MQIVFNQFFKKFSKSDNPLNFILFLLFLLFFFYSVSPDEKLSWNTQFSLALLPIKKENADLRR